MTHAFTMLSFRILLAICITALLGIVYPATLVGVAMVSFVGMVYVLWQQKQKDFKPQSNSYKVLEKIKKKQVKKAHTQHKYIGDQINYIAHEWGYTKEQAKIIEKFIDGRKYGDIYNKLTASLLPQMITLIDKCNDKNQKGCKREVSKRLRELTDLMKVELKKQNSQTIESYETNLEVYDQIMKN
ncbi:MAG: Unknown protein [uncultured Sulfurovum sp.]|uniref:5-bromo-4-chloroindolyl phosphate hydrolysis protein n=1 Tax=uncultured Sulfurovum sp. TaxID=269237 RepID=A0A6S6TF44_9BACT|nr:MAG: Unknown protein [uncultured Sulfurovum sp.]